MKAFNLATLAVATTLLSACGGDDQANTPLTPPPGAALCRAIGGGGATVTTSAAMGAQFSQPNNVFDADFTTFAVLDTPNGTGTSSIRGILQPGLVEPSGQAAGVLLSASAMIAASEVTITTSTTNGGTTTDGDTGTATVVKMVGDASTGIDYFYGISTTKTFNSISVEFALMNDPVQLNLFELCIGR